MNLAVAESEWGHRSGWPWGSVGLGNWGADPLPAARPVVSPQSTISYPRWFDQTLRRVLELIKLGPNWDNRGSATVSRDALNFALQVLWRTMAATTAAPSIVPLGNGGIQLLWSNALAEIEVEVIRPNEIIIYYLDRRTGAEREDRAETEFSELADLLRANFT